MVSRHGGRSVPGDGEVRAGSASPSGPEADPSACLESPGNRRGRSFWASSRVTTARAHHGAHRRRAALDRFAAHPALPIPRPASRLESETAPFRSAAVANDRGSPVTGGPSLGEGGAPGFERRWAEQCLVHCTSMTVDAVTIPFANVPSTATTVPTTRSLALVPVGVRTAAEASTVRLSTTKLEMLVKLTIRPNR